VGLLDSLSRSKGIHHMQYLLFKHVRVLYYIQNSGQKSYVERKKHPRKAACTSIPSFFIANIFLLNDREPQVNNLGKDGGGRVSPAIESMQQGLH